MKYISPAQADKAARIIKKTDDKEVLLLCYTLIAFYERNVEAPDDFIKEFNSIYEGNYDEPTVPRPKFKEYGEGVYKNYKRKQGN